MSNGRSPAHPEPPAVFTTERLFARAWDPERDVAGAFALYGDPEVVRFIGGNLVADLDAQREHLRQIIGRIARFPEGQGSWPTFDAESGEMVGTALLKPLPKSGTDREPSNDIEVGWHLARAHWGRGFATEMGRALLRYGCHELKLPVLHAVVETPNARSLAVARRIGLRHVGTTDAYYDHVLEHFILERRDFRE